MRWRGIRLTLSLAASLLICPPARAIPAVALLPVLGALGVTAISDTLLLAITIIVNIGLSLLASLLLRPKTPSNDRQASETTIQIGEGPRQAIFGQAATAGTLMDGLDHDGQYGTDWETLRIAIADHECSALVGFFVNDTYVAYTGDGFVPGYDNKLYINWYPGTETQAADGNFITFGSYSSSDNGAGVAQVVIQYHCDAPNASTVVWPGGRPRFLWIVKGAKCYDRRLDSTVGGSGTHRANDPTTWAWSENPIVCREAWERGIYACHRITQPDMLLVGRGLTDAELQPFSSFVANANLCDEAVALASGSTEARYRVGALVKSDDDFISTEEAFAAACAGTIIQVEGAVAVEPGQAKTVVAYITDDNIVSGSTVTFSQYRAESDDAWINTVIPQFVSPTQEWQTHGAPIRRVEADVIADGKSREDTLSLEFVTSISQAQRCGEIARRLGRLEATAKVTLGPRFCALEQGDWIVWTSARRTGGEPTTFRVEGFSLDEKWQNTLQLRAIEPDVYDWETEWEAADGAVAEATDAPPAIAAPAASAWAFTSTSVTLGGIVVPAVVFTGASDNPYAAGIKFEYRHSTGTGQADDADWIELGISNGDATARRFTGMAAATDYQGAVSYLVDGFLSPRRIIGAPSGSGSGVVTTPGGPDPNHGAYKLISQSLAYPVTSDDSSVSIAAFTGVTEDGRTINFTAGGRTGLPSGSSFEVLWNTLDSSWHILASPALAPMASPDAVWVGSIYTSTSGTYPTSPTPPGGFRGGGGGAIP